MQAVNNSTSGAQAHISDPYGNLGAISTPSWNERWMDWPRHDQERYMADVANWPCLNFNQMRHILQGLLPSNHQWIYLNVCLSDVAPIVGRLKEDIERKAMPQNPTPEEFAAWCDAINVRLPEPFVEKLQEIQSCANTHPKPTRQSATQIDLPQWAAMLPTSTDTNVVTKPKLGRPKKEQSDKNYLIEAATKILLDAAEQGQIKTLKQIAKELQVTPIGRTKSFAAINRYLKGALPIEQAKSLARKMRSVKSKGMFID